MNTRATNVHFTIGARHILSVPRMLMPVSFSLENLISGEDPIFPAIEGSGDGYYVRSAPAIRIDEVTSKHPGFVVGALQFYSRCYIDMKGDYESYLAKFSSKTRSTFSRKRRKLIEFSGGTLDIRSYQTPQELEEFLGHAVPLSRRTYQGRLLDAGLPESAADQAHMMALAAQGNVRAFLLFIEGRAVSYLYLPVHAGTISYAFLGYDPDFAHMSLGTVLQLDALESLFSENRYRYFDFTEGEGAHKELFATDKIAACTFLMLRGRIGNRVLASSLDTFNAMISAAAKLAEKTGAKTAIRQLLRK
jgi:CelD/BcsL family acetyltransferase involved in cellulose biosynthesis